MVAPAIVQDVKQPGIECLWLAQLVQSSQCLGECFLYQIVSQCAVMTPRPRYSVQAKTALFEAESERPLLEKSVNRIHAPPGQHLH
jgi:hypothetical protein